MKPGKKILRYSLVGVCELLTITNIIHLMIDGKFSRLLLACLTLVLILVPEGVERLFRCRFSQPLYLISILYAIGPMLGHCNDFYYQIPGWDKLLHILGGVMFVFVGVFLFELLGGDTKKWALCCVFALCFSLSLSVLWEFFEFSSDTLVGTDMQVDTIVHSVHSHMLTPVPGNVGTITDIHSVLVDGVPLNLGGYMDIGLIDTMMDMLLETLGAVAATVFIWLDHNRHPFFQRKEQSGIC